MEQRRGLHAQRIAPDSDAVLLADENPLSFERGADLILGRC